MFEIGFSENTPAECLLQRPIPRKRALPLAKLSTPMGFAQKEKNAVFAMNAAFLLSLKQYVILYLYVVLTYFMCTFPKKAQKFCDPLLNRNLHTVSIPQIYHL